MKQLLELLPIVLFFIAYKMYDIYVATAVVMAATLVLVAYSWIRYRKVETMQWVTLGIVVVMGGLTLYLQDEQFIKWKLSIVEWAFGLAFIGSQFIGSKTLAERILSAALELPANLYRLVNQVWAGFLIGIGSLNVYVMYNYTTDEWVTFKTFIVPCLTLVFTALPVAYFYFKYAPEDGKPEPEQKVPEQNEDN
jgi:intracellular septation protein